jgi:hypothetical protein
MQLHLKTVGELWLLYDAILAGGAAGCEYAVLAELRKRGAV